MTQLNENVFAWIIDWPCRLTLINTDIFKTLKNYSLKWSSLIKMVKYRLCLCYAHAFIVFQRCVKQNYLQKWQWLFLQFSYCWTLHKWIFCHFVRSQCMSLRLVRFFTTHTVRTNCTVPGLSFFGGCLRMKWDLAFHATVVVWYEQCVLLHKLKLQVLLGITWHLREIYFSFRMKWGFSLCLFYQYCHCV